MSDDRQLPYVLATPQHRLAGRAVDYGFYFVTFGIGWLIWNLIVWTDGRTPGHQVLKMRIYSTDTKKPVSWGHMALRQFAFLWKLSKSDHRLNLLQFYFSKDDVPDRSG